MYQSPFEAQMWAVCREASGIRWNPGTPGWNVERASRLDSLAGRLEEIFARHGRGDQAVAKPIQEARSYMQAQAKALRDFPNTTQPEGDFLAIPTGVEVRLRRAVDAHNGRQRLSPTTNSRLDSMIDGVHKAGDLLEYGKVDEAIKTLDQLSRSIRAFRTDLVKQTDRGVER